MKMTKKYKILAKYIKDISGETSDLDTYLHVREKITKCVPPGRCAAANRFEQNARRTRTNSHFVS